MLKEYEWQVTVDGSAHTILCQVMENKYVLWADDEHIQTIYRKAFQRTRGGIDKPLEVWGKKCRFVVWQDERVEFFLEGQSLTGQEDDESAVDSSYEESLRRHQRSMRRCSWVAVIITALACVSYLAMALAGVDVSGWTVTFVGALIILILNVITLLLGREKQKMS